MRRKRALIALGTRPEAVKLFPLIRALRGKSGIRTSVCVTAQHRALLDRMLELFRIRPRHDLNLMRRGQTPDQVAERVLRSIRPVLREERPDLLVVQGDTTTAAAAAWAAFHHRVPVAHVEAGLRSHDLSQPFPEESNRVLIDRLSTLLFAPTPDARANLRREGLEGEGVFVTGNTVIDSVLWAAEKSATARSRAGAEGAVLVTLHRRESFGRPLRRLFEALLSIVRDNPEAGILYPVHPNPSVRLAARRVLRHPRIRLTPPLPYLDFVRAMRDCRFILTDSGGLTEEAAALGKPVLVAREAADRPESLRTGGSLLVGREPARVTREAARLLRDERVYKRMCRAHNPFGDGRAGERIASAIEWSFGLRRRPRDWK